ncbi:MAG: phage tail sheath family protein, partial [Azovibrio sp.]
QRTGMQALLDTYNMMGFFAKILIAPGYCVLNSVATDMIAMAHKLRAVALIDAPIGTSYAQAIAGRGPSGVINFNTSSERAVLCYPHLKVYDAATDSERLEPLSQRLAGVMCAKDTEKGYWWSPSNTEIKGITGVERQLSAMINDAQSEVNLLNEVGIVTLFNSFGTGIRTWGNRSAAWPTVTHVKNFINIRRTADILHESVEYSMLQFIDWPINDALIDAIKESVNSFIRTLISRGALIDGECTYDPTKNPSTEIALGHLTFDLEFIPPTPAERITFESFINIELLKQLGK